MSNLFLEHNEEKNQALADQRRRMEARQLNSLLSSKLAAEIKAVGLSAKWEVGMDGMGTLTVVN